MQDGRQTRKCQKKSVAGDCKLPVFTTDEADACAKLSAVCLWHSARVSGKIGQWQDRSVARTVSVRIDCNGKYESKHGNHKAY